MKRIFTVVFGALLIHHSLAAFGSWLFRGDETKGHVLAFTPMQNEESYGGFVPLPKHIDPENNLHRENTEKKVKFTSGKDMLVKCVEDDNEAKAFVFGPEGYFIDRLTLKKTKKEKDVCKQLLDNIEMGPIHASTSTIRNYKFTFSLLYTFHVKNKPQCLSRIYTVAVYLHYPTLERGSEEMTNCKETVIDTPDSKKEYLLPREKYEIMEFSRSGVPVENPVLTTFKTEVNLKIKCQKYAKSSMVGGTTLAIGYIMYDDNIILEKLPLDTCTDEGIYINTVGKYAAGDREFTLVFKKQDGNCFKMVILFVFDDILKKKVIISRHAPERVHCPNDWTSDAALAVGPVATWYKILESYFQTDSLDEEY